MNSCWCTSILAYILCCECVLLFLLLNRHTATNTVSSMAVLSTAPMITLPTHGSEVLTETNVVDVGILHDGVNVPVCVNVNITVNTIGCGFSTDMVSFVN